MTERYCEVCLKELTDKQKRFCSNKCSFYVYARKVKKEAIDAYGERCLTCDIDDIDMLVLHHSLFDGEEHKKETGISSGYNYNLWLKRNYYPINMGLVVLCHNHHSKIHIEEKKPKNDDGRGV